MAPKTSSHRTLSRTERRRAAVHRRRQQATARTAAARRVARRKRAIKGVAAFIVLGALTAGGVTLFLRRGGSGPSATLKAKKVAGATGRLAIIPAPASYHGVYRAESYSGTKTTVSTEDVSVNRPFQGRVAIREGEPPGNKAQFEGRSAFAVYANLTDAGATQIAGDAPTVALGDVRVAASLDELVDDGLFVPGARRKALGVECQTYRTGSPIQSLKITAPTATDFVDVCLDASGLIIEEVAITAGKPAQRLTATKLELDATIDPSLFAIDGPRLGTDAGGADVTEVDRSVAPKAGYWALPAPPAGFTQMGRYLIAAGEGSSYIDVYVRGVDVVTVRQGDPGAEPDLSDSGPGRDTDLGPLGAGQTLLRTVGPTLIAHPGSTAFVHVAGSISPADLKGIAAGLRQS